MSLTAWAVILLPAGPVHAVRFAANGLSAEPATVYLTRTITVRAVLEETAGLGSDVMEVSCTPEPGRLVRPAGALPPPAFTCTGGGRSEGWWGWEAVAPGTVRFRVTASLVVCETGAAETAEMVTEPIVLKPVPIGTRLEIGPGRVAPGETIEITLSVRNDGTEEAIFGKPAAEPDMTGRSVLPVEALGGPVADPAGSLRGGQMALGPGQSVRVSWRFRASELGLVKFRVVAAGLIMMTDPVMVRRPATLDLSAPDPTVPLAVGRTFVLRADLGVSGETGVVAAGVAVAWSPPDAARLVSESLSATMLDPGGPPARAAFSLDLLKPGTLTLTVSAGGIQQDCGRPAAPVAVTRTLKVQAPPRLECLLEVASATAMVGSELRVRVGVRNTSGTAAQGLGPMFMVREGKANVLAFSPMHQGVLPGATVWFTGAVMPMEAGPVELVAQVTGRGDRGGNWITAVSEPAGFRSVAEPRLLVFALGNGVWEAATETVRFLVRNDGPDAVRIVEAAMPLSTVAGIQVSAGRPKPVPLTLAPGAGATLSFPLWLPGSKSPYSVSGTFNASGVLPGYGLSFSAHLPPRQIVAVFPRASAITAVEPSDVFRPPLDPLLYVEWTVTGDGEAALAVVTPEGRLVRVLEAAGPARAGRHTTLWRGDTDAGARLTPGRYLLRLAGPPRVPVDPAAGAAGWGGEAEWRVDRAFEVGAP